MTSAQCQQTAENWFDKGTALRNQYKYDEAIKAYDEAIISLDPNYAAAWNDKGIALDGSGKYEEAIQTYNKALEIYKLVLNSGSIGYPSSMIYESCGWHGQNDYLDEFQS